MAIGHNDIWYFTQEQSFKLNFIQTGLEGMTGHVTIQLTEKKLGCKKYIYNFFIFKQEVQSNIIML